KTAVMWKNIVEKVRVADDHEHGYETDKWINPDIAPLPPSRRNWGIWAYLGWGSIANLCISAWTGAASLLSLGLTVPQTIGLMIIARILMVALIIGNGWIGGEWHIGFAVHQRMILGMRGAYITQAMRIMLSIVWYGSQAWLGGLCVSAMISSWSSSFLNMENTFAASANMVTRDFIGFLLFHLISVPFLLIRPENSKPYVITANVIVLIVMLAITIWAGVNGGTGPLFVSGARQPGVLSTGWAWVYGIISNLGVISAGIVNQSDFTRFARRQGLQVPGMAFSLLVPGMIVPIFAIITASASMSIWGLDQPFWNPLSVILQWLIDDYSPGARAAAFFCSLGFTKLVVVGYSQGAHVALDTLCGSSLSGFTPSAAQASAVGGSIAAVILAGDPTFVPGLPSNRGTSQDAGIFQTRDMTQCGDVPAKTLSFCDTNDRFCASGESIPVHLGYFNNAATRVYLWGLDNEEHKSPTRPEHAEALIHGSFQESVIGPDNRERVVQRDFMPGGVYRAIVKLFLRFENQAEDDPWAMATGWLIRKDLLVTAGHCAYDHSHGLGRLLHVKAYVGYSGKESIIPPEPSVKDKFRGIYSNYKVEFRTGKAVVTTESWHNNGSFEAADLSFIQLSSGFEGVDPIKYSPTPIASQSKLGVIGYPGDLLNPDIQHSDEKGAVMWEMYLKDAESWDTRLSSSNPEGLLQYTIDTYGAPQEGFFDSMSAYVKKIAPLVTTIGPKIVGAVAEPALRLALSNIPKPPGTETEIPKLRPGRSNDTKVAGFGPKLPNANHEAFITTLGSKLTESDTEGFLEVTDGPGQVIRKGLRVHVRPLDQSIKDFHDLVKPRGTESTFQDPQGWKFKGGITERAILGEAALLTLMDTDVKKLEQEGLFDIIKSVVKTVGPVVIKAAPVVFKAVTPIVQNALADLSKNKGGSTEALLPPVNQGWLRLSQTERNILNADNEFVNWDTTLNNENNAYNAVVLEASNAGVLAYNIIGKRFSVYNAAFTAGQHAVPHGVPNVQSIFGFAAAGVNILGSYQQGDPQIAFGWNNQSTIFAAGVNLPANHPWSLAGGFVAAFVDASSPQNYRSQVRVYGQRAGTRIQVGSDAVYVEMGLATFVRVLSQMRSSFAQNNV
ncbi:hypothetical protein BN1723_006776, partial [Verticillium longisporum]